VWAAAKIEYIALLVNHKQPELAETFFNSVSTKLLAKEYYNNQFIFVKPAISTEYIDSDPPTFSSFYPSKQGLRDCLRDILKHFGMCRLPTPPKTSAIFCARRGCIFRAIGRPRK
jgi:isocitrate dehydrogenase kinase/phosphatase